jgi:hypothetical protein
MTNTAAPSPKTIRIGSGAGYSGDRIDPAVELATHGRLHYLVFECLAERTIALAQQARLRDPSSGYDPLLAERMHAVLPLCHQNGITLISNMGAANPIAAAHKTRAIALEHGLTSLRIAAITGDDILPILHDETLSHDLVFEETGQPIPSLIDRIVSANAYLGIEPLLEALAHNANVILTGRVADPSLFLAPLVHEFAWSPANWHQLGQGTVVGHLLECAGQLTGGYFADPGYKDVPDLAHLGFPIAEVSADGNATLTKVEGSGGCITPATCTEQLLYEVQNPAAYLTPDVTADFSGVCFAELAPNRIRVTGATGHPRPDRLKASIGYRDGFVGEGQISYAGPGALALAQLAGQIVEERLRAHPIRELRIDLIGLNAIHGPALSPQSPEPYELRLRIAGKADTQAAAAMIQREVEALYTNGPSGGGGATGFTRESIAMLSTLIPRSLMQPRIEYLSL